MKLYLLALGLCIPTTSFSGGELVAKIYNYTTGYYNKQLLAATAAGDAKGVLDALNNGADVDYQKPFPPQSGSFRARFWSLRERAMAEDEPGTALHYCAKNGCLEIANILLDHGAQTTSENCHKHIPLCVAAEHFQSGMFKLLLEKTPDGPTKTMQCKMAYNLVINFQCGANRIPHRDAIINAAQEYLIKRKGEWIERTLRSSKLFTKLPLDIQKVIIAFATTKKLENDLLNAVIREDYGKIDHEDIRKAEAALREGANVNMIITKSLHPTLFHIAVWNNNTQLARLLLDYCIDITEEDLKKRGLFHTFTSTKQIRPFIQLIQEYEAKRARPPVVIEEVES